MKKSLFILLVMSLLVVLPIVSAEATLSADLLKYEPIPAQPGQYIHAYIELANVGDTAATGAVIEVVDAFPFTVAGENTEVVGDLNVQRSSVVDFRIKVDSQAPVGNNLLKIRYSPDGKNWQERSLNIDVKSNDVSLSVADVSTSPDEFTPGGDGIITLKLKNSDSVPIRSIAAKLGLVSVSGSTVVDLPFIPDAASTEQKISRLSPDEVSEVSFPIKVYPTATPGYYKIPLTLTFYDDQGTQTEKQELVGVVVKSVPDLMVYVEKTTISQPGQSGDVTLKFVNKGISNLKFLDVSLDNGDGYDVISGSQQYIGDLDSDDYRSETFTIRPTDKTADLNVAVSYMDGNNNEFNKVLSVPFEAVSSSNGEKKGPSFSTILLILVLIVVLISWIRRRRRAKKHHK